MLFLLSILDSALQLAEIAVVVWVVLGWVLSLGLAGPFQLHAERLLLFLDGLFTPLVRPLRRLIPPVGGLDFSPLFLLLAIFALRAMVSDLARALLQTA